MRFEDSGEGWFALASFLVDYEEDNEQEDKKAFRMCTSTECAKLICLALTE